MVEELDLVIDPSTSSRFEGFWGKRILASGSRIYHSHKNGAFITKTLNALYPLFVIHGGDDGADRWVQLWCLETNTGFATVPCHHRGRLRPEESVRRQHAWMLELEPDLVLAFPGSAKNLLDVAKSAGVPVLSITEEMLELGPPGNID